MSYDNDKQIIVSKVVSDKARAPTLRVSLEIDGVKYKAGLWHWTRRDGSSVTDKNGNSQYKGTLEIDDFRSGPKTQGAQQDHGPGPDDFDDDIPFS